MGKKKISAVVCGGFGLLCLTAGCVLIYVFNELIHKEVDSSLPLKPGSESYKNWAEPKSPIYFQVYVFDIVNHKEVKEKGAKPALNTIGPFTYREHRQKVNISSFSNGTIRYEELRFFNFERDMSVDDESREFYTINLPMLTIINIMKNEFSALKEVLELIFELSKDKIFIKLSVADLMWGYDDHLLEYIIEEAHKLHINITLSPKFGLFLGQNGTGDGFYEINSGAEGVSNFGEIITWKGNRTLNYWNSDIANAINGSDGTLYPPFISTSESKFLFSSDLCRSIELAFSKSVTNRDIPMKRFTAPKSLFGNVTVNPYNEGFCTPPGNCLPSGLLNVSVCREGAPIVMSMPNFYGCDEDVINSVIGIVPKKEDSESYIDIEPMTGLVMSAQKRLQINAFINKTEGFEETKNFKPMFLPVMFLNESALIRKKDADKFKSEVLDRIQLTDAVKYSLIAFGSFVFVLVVVLVLRKRVCRRKEDELRYPILNNDDPLLDSTSNGSAGLFH